MPHLLNATFYTSAHERRDLPKHSGIEIAFSGRSNAGKSSAINALTNRNHLAFVSKTPGRTQLINFFQLASNQFLVDLPGYGYAKVPEHVRLHWKNLLSNYLQTRNSLRGLILVMDIRHPLKPQDIQMLDWFSSTGKVIHILLTKADKLSKQQANIILQKVALFIKEFYPQCSVQLFSSKTNIGVEDAMIVITEWLRIN